MKRKVQHGSTENEFERLRREKIARNNEMLMSLGIQKLTKPVVTVIANKYVYLILKTWSYTVT